MTKKIAKKMGNIYFTASNKWLANLRKIHQIVFHKVCSGAVNVCEETVTVWVAKLPTTDGYNSGHCKWQ
jgi:hypothetical protein